MSIKQDPRAKSFTIIIVVLAVLAAAVCVNSAVIVSLLHKNKEHDNQQLSAQIINGVEDSRRPLVQDISGKRYIPEARLALPATSTSLGEVLYSYTPATNGADEDIRIASNNSIRAAESPLKNAGTNTQAIINATPKLQACGRGVHVTFAQQDGQTANASKLLSSGKTAYFYTEEACSNPELVSYVKQIDSY